LDYWQRAFTVFDAAIEKKLGHGWKVFVKADNLFGTRTTVDLLRANPDLASKLVPEQERADRITVMRQTVRANYYAGVKWSLR
jgi:hypothetical protein